MTYVPTGKPRGRPRKDGSSPQPKTPPAPIVKTETHVVVLDSQSPISNLWLHDARKCYEAAEWLETEARKAGGMTGVVVGAMKVASELRKQSAESLAVAQERAKAEKTTTAKAGLSILPPQTNRLLANAKIAIEKLAEAAQGPAAEATPTKAEVA